MKINNKIATVSEFIKYYMQSAFSLSKLIFRNKKLLNEKFIEKIMLTITAVNGCKICSQAHAKMALESGMSEKEIDEFLSNDDIDYAENEGVAMLFATHYADTNAKPDKESVNRLISTYGRNDSNSIIAAIRMIMVGNVLGIAGSTFLGRFNGNRNKESSLFRELGIFALTVLLIPLYLIFFIIGFFFKG